MSTTGMERNEMPEDPETYDATEVDENKWGALRMIGLLALIAAFAGFVYLAYMQGVRNGAVGAPPVISAETGPYKVAPQNPGGQSFANQDKIIFDRVEGTSPDDGKSAAPPPAPSQSTASGDDLVSHNSAPLVVADNPSSAASPKSSAPAPSASHADGHADGIAAAIEQADAQAKPAQVKPTPPPAETKVATAEPPPAPKSAPPAAAAAAGAYAVQVASYTDMPSAQDAWKKLSAKFGDIVGSHAADYQTADIPGKGTYYRLRVAGFDSKDSASAFCQQLKAKSQGCIVVKG